MKNVIKLAIFLSVVCVFFAAAVVASAQTSSYYCTNNSYQRCVGNNLYWFDSCGNQQGLIQYCQDGCYNNACSQHVYSQCTNHAYRLCSGNNVFWYDSCGNQQDLYANCSSSGLTCQYGQCAVYQPPVPPEPPIPPTPPYVPHYAKKCYNNNLYWYDSLGERTGLYKTCADTNSCTADSCSAGKCSNILKCDGSTCATGSADYNKYCATSGQQQQQNISGFSILFFAKQDANSLQWQKSVQVSPNGQLYFMISVANSGSATIDNVNVSANIPSEITSLGNLQVNGAATSGDVVAGVNIGSLTSGTAKTITFEGKTQSFTASESKQATATAKVGSASQSDSLTINLSSSNQPAGETSNKAGSGLLGFLKKWYLWILVAVVLIFLFVVVFRRLSSSS
jgi:hypothetical protein